MISPSDPDYIETKEILLGRKSIRPEFQSIVDWIKVTFDVRVLNVYYDRMPQSGQPRLEVCVADNSEKHGFMERGLLRYRKTHQTAIAEKFRDVIAARGLGSQYPSDDLFVYISAFDHVAKIEANASIPQAEVDQLLDALHNPDLWLISRSFAAVTFFVYTDAQVRTYVGSNMHDFWTDRYFELLSRYDSLHVFKQEAFSILIDSKENFENNYGSSWYYYYK